MGKTKIQYADRVSNPLFVIDKVTGKHGTHCEKPDPDGTCEKCWAENLNMRGKPDNKRFGTGLPYERASRDRITWHRHEIEMRVVAGLNRRKAGSEKFPGQPCIVFTNDTYDLFQPSISDDLRDWVFDQYDRFVNLTLLIQSTYVSRMALYLTHRYPAGMPEQYMIGMSAGTQGFYEKNTKYLLQVRTPRRYIIFEPLLEEIDLFCDKGGRPHPWASTFTDQVALIIIGGESGDRHCSPRACDARWIRRIVRDASAVGTSVLVKQMGVHCRDGVAESRCWPVGTKIEGGIASTAVPEYSVRIRLSRKGGDPAAWPVDLRVRQFPSLQREARSTRDALSMDEEDV